MFLLPPPASKLVTIETPARRISIKLANGSRHTIFFSVTRRQTLRIGVCFLLRVVRARGMRVGENLVWNGVDISAVRVLNKTVLRVTIAEIEHRDQTLLPGDDIESICHVRNAYVLINTYMNRFELTLPGRCHNTWFDTNFPIVSSDIAKPAGMWPGGGIVPEHTRVMCEWQSVKHALKSSRRHVPLPHSVANANNVIKVL